MRTIKFRGKSLATGEWLHGSHFNDGAEDYILPNLPSGAIDYESYQVDQNTIGQFTGLFDKNCKEIYEGDIVKHPYIDPIFQDLVETKDGVTSEVVFHDGAFVIKYDINDHIYLCDFTRHNHAEVVGNIYDNPELLNMCRMIK